jgi:hypothetical protein
MDDLSLFVVLLFIALIVGYVSAGKERDRLELCAILIYGVGILGLFWQNFAVNVLRLSGDSVFLTKYALPVLWLTEAIIWIALAVRYCQNKRTHRR